MRWGALFWENHDWWVAILEAARARVACPIRPKLSPQRHSAPFESSIVSYALSKISRPHAQNNSRHYQNTYIVKPGKLVRARVCANAALEIDIVAFLNVVSVQVGTDPQTKQRHNCNTIMEHVICIKVVELHDIRITRIRISKSWGSATCWGQKTRRNFEEW